MYPFFLLAGFYDRPPTRSALPPLARARTGRKGGRKDTLIKFDLGLSRQISPGPRRSQILEAIKLVFRSSIFTHSHNKTERNVGSPRLYKIWPPRNQCCEYSSFLERGIRDVDDVYIAAFALRLGVFQGSSSNRGENKHSGIRARGRKDASRQAHSFSICILHPSRRGRDGG